METETKTNSKKNFKVRVGEFEGPLELLLDLIEKRKLHISSVSLSSVADEFIEHTKSFENFPISDSADFILVASTLLLIKSKSLLPNLDLSTEEQESIEDLENRLATYKRYKDLAAGLSKIFGNFLYFGRERKHVSVVFSPTSEINIFSIREAMNRVLQNAPQRVENLPKIAVRKIVSLEEMISKLSERIGRSLRTSFSDFVKTTADKRNFSQIGKADGSTNSPQEKINIIVSFLAMLELVKRGIVRVSQDNHFDDINMESEYLGTPKY